MPIEVISSKSTELHIEAFSLIMTGAWYALLLAAVFCSQATAVEVSEAVLEEGASGTAVVLLSVAHIQQAAIFPDDNQLLRRIAYVESRDGTDFDIDSEGGIWAVNEAAFESTKDSSNALLAQKYDILQQFNIIWQSVQLSDLRRPLYSALAARLVLFRAPRAIPSDTDVAGQAQFWRENYNTDGSVDKFIRSTMKLQGGLLESSSSDFYVGFTKNNVNLRSGTETLRLFVTTREPDPVNFTVDTLLGLNFTGVATHDSTTIISLDVSQYEVLNSDERNKGIHVSAGDKQIVVYGLNYYRYSSDAFLALPCSRLAVDQYEYYGINYNAFQSQLLFVGCEDNTTINFSSTTITLNQMETYLYETNSGITGTRVVSNKPISLFSGEPCARIRRGTCDHIVEQIPPTATWGTDFLSGSFSSRRSGEIYRILASHPSTNVSVNCTTYTQPETYNLATAGAWQEFRTPDDSFCVIESNKPLLVAEFALGGRRRNNVLGPFMMMLPSVEQYSNDYVFNAPAEFTTNFITIFVTPEYFEPENIFVDDISQERANWITIHCLDRSVCGYAAYASLETGDHRLYHSDPLARIGVSAYGFSFGNSYGYPGDFNIRLQSPIISFSQETYFVGENENTVNVSVVRSGITTSRVVLLIASDPTSGSATAEQDYSTVTEVLEFSPGDTEKEVAIRILGDRSSEPDESFVLYISNVAGVILTRAEVTIINSDDMESSEDLEICPAEETTLITTNTTHSWPATVAGVTVFQPCPSLLESSHSVSVSRYCGGSLHSSTSGAVWSDVDYSQCIEWVASVLDTQTSQPEELLPEMVSEIIELTYSVLTDEAIVDPKMAKLFLDILDRLLQVNASVLQQSEEQSDTPLSSRAIESLGRFQDEVELSPNATNGSQVFTRERCAIQVRDIEVMTFSGESFNVDLGSYDEALSLNTSIPEEAIQTTVDALANVTVSMTVPPNLITDLQQGANQSNESRRLSYNLYLTDILFQSPNQTAQNLSIGTVIVAIRLRGITTNRTVPLLVNNTFRVSEAIEAGRASYCVQWKASNSDKFGEWSSDGCREVESGGEEKICECSVDRPSTHFAVLFDLNPSPPPPGVGTALEVITYVGLTASVLSLIIMIATYLFSKNLRNSQHGQILLNICISLLGLYIFFLIAGHVTGVTVLCGVVSALLHYFILVFFGWSATEAVYLYIKLVVVLGTNKYERGFILKAATIIWLTPLLIVSISLAGYEYYPSKYYCRPTQWPFFFGLVLPVAVIIIFNWVMFVVVIVSIFMHAQTSAAAMNKVKIQRIKQKLITTMALAVMFGLGWGLGFLATSTAVQGITITFQIIFSLLVGSQGLLLLIIHGFRSEKAREAWKQCIKAASGRHAKAFSLTTASNFDSGTRSASVSAPSYSMATLGEPNPPESVTPSTMETTDRATKSGDVVIAGLDIIREGIRMEERDPPTHLKETDEDGSKDLISGEQPNLERKEALTTSPVMLKKVREEAV